MQRSFVRLGFDVRRAHDLDNVEMKREIDRFLRRNLSRNEIVIYFSGRYVNYNGDAFLLPSDFEADRFDLRDLTFRAFPLRDLTERLRRSQKQGALFIDGCYQINLPGHVQSDCRARSLGLGNVLVPINSRTPIPADNHNIASTFATALAGRLLEPDVEIGSHLFRVL